MSLKAGIVGLPNVGKSTLFNAITNSRVEAANYPFATIEPNHGVVELRDARLSNLAALVKAQRTIFATFEFIDIAGLVAGASAGEGLGNKFLANIREVDAIIHVVRCFENSEILHVYKRVDPVSDAKIINLELILADLQTMTNILQRLNKRATTLQGQHELALAAKVKAALEQEKPARALQLTPEDTALLRTWQLLTAKPMLYVANLGEGALKTYTQDDHFKALQAHATDEKTRVIPIVAQLEAELSSLELAEQAMLMDELGLKETGLNQLVRASFDLLGLATYFTAGVKEARAWVFKKGMSAAASAGIIHTDFERGFIKADVISYTDFATTGSEAAARSAGKLRSEGRDYLVRDGDVMHFKFNV